LLFLSVRGFAGRHFRRAKLLTRSSLQGRDAQRCWWCEFKVNLRDVDLNLLVVFDALLRTRSVTRAAQVLGMSQPATSFALSKLRQMLRDPLFVRAANGIHPTPYAERLAEPLDSILDSIRFDLLRHQSFDPATLQRSFTLAMHDIGELAFLPPIMERVSTLAPAIEIRTMNLPLPELEPALRSGEIDLVVGYFPELQSASLFQQRLFAHSFVCLVRRDHPTIGSEMTREQFVDGKHAVVHTDSSSLEDTLEADLREMDLARRVVLRVQHYLALPAVLSRSDLIVTVPYAIGVSLSRMGDLKLVNPPFKTQARIVRQHWHSRFHRDPANKWIRNLVAELFVESREH
jgi:DNA-binding transcriptional LysR family regulator